MWIQFKCGLMSSEWYNLYSTQKNISLRVPEGHNTEFGERNTTQPCDLTPNNIYFIKISLRKCIALKLFLYSFILQWQFAFDIILH